jgi:hypothetical protein
VISVQEAIANFRRDVTVGLVLKGVMGVAAGMVLALHFTPLSKVLDPTLLLMILGGIWLSLWYRTMKGSRLAAESTSLIASGHFEQAEAQIEQSLRAFSMSPTVKSMSLINLAIVRLAQKRWPDTALLCREVLSAKKSASEQVSKSGRLLLADSLLEMGDLRGAHEALSGLYRYRLSLPEALNLLRVQTNYLARIGAWRDVVQNLAEKVGLAELMPAAKGAQTQALLALAASKVGLTEWANWLRRRVELLVDVPALIQERPVLSEVWEPNRAGPTESEPPTAR